MKLKYPIILASASPRRRELMTDAGYAFEVIASPVPEPLLPSEKGASAAVWAETLAYFKARSVQQHHPEAIVIGADTVVTHSGLILGKPKDRADARRILTTLFEGRNDVITGLAVLTPDPPGPQVTHVRSTLIMRPMDPDELDAYLAGGAWRDKAGAYAIQEGGDKFVESIEGSHSNIVGLPLEKLAALLKGLVCLLFCLACVWVAGCDQEPSEPLPPPAVQKLPTETFHIAGEDFEIELAFRQKTRAQGLMFRKSLGQNEGMFFVFRRPQMQSFYMKNCWVDLDILFIRADSTIASMETMKAPVANAPLVYYQSDEPTKYVLELPAGTIQRLALQPGQKLALPARIARIIPEPDY